MTKDVAIGGALLFQGSDGLDPLERAFVGSSGRSFDGRERVAFAMTRQDLPSFIP